MATLHPEFHFDPPAPFRFGGADAPVWDRKAEDRGPSSYIVFKQTDLEAGAFERPEVETVEVLVMWGSTILFARHLPSDRGFEIGEGSRAAPVDFEVSSHELGMPRVRLLEARDRELYVTIPKGAVACVKRAADAGFARCDAANVALASGTVVEIRVAKLSFRIANVAGAQKTPRARLGAADRPLLAACALSFGAAAALLASFAFWMPALGLNDGEDIDSERLYTMKQYLNAEAERNREEQAEKAEAGHKDAEPGAPAQAAQGREGALGKQGAPVTNRRAAVRGDSPSTELSRAQVLNAARSFGMIDLLGSLSSTAGSSSPFAMNDALGHDSVDAEGNMWGDQIGESGGNGLRLAGPDNGGGGHGRGVGLDGVGTCGTGNCGPSGFAHGVGRLGDTHTARSPHIRSNGSGTVSGRLPAEVVQRIVRQNYGRFRMCYENGLRRNPNLTGRVSARFVIGREGSVSNAQNGGSDLPDAGVVSCVVQAFYGLSFPTPENGIVSVSYPIMFSPG